ncbi:MAG: hypothetical protein IPK13_15355 [Deltaproteobacteria bacterium]|nr:hypothetical protein [Deltaproteobacteria bacterium]
MRSRAHKLGLGLGLRVGLGFCLQASSFFAFGPYAAAQTVFGYQVGVTQSVGTTVTNNSEVFQAQDDVLNGQVGVARMQGLELGTTVNANMTVDLATSMFEHSGVIGASFSQIIPTATNEDVLNTFRERVTTLQATAGYLGRRITPTFTWAWAARYGFGLNGRLGNASNGSVQGGGAGNTLPGAELGAFVVNGQTHTIDVETSFEFLRPLWDARIGLNYGYANNQVFTLVGGLNSSANTGTTNIGAFVPMTAQTVGASVSYRRRIQQSTIEAGASALLTLPQAPDVTGTSTGSASSSAGILQAPRSLTQNMNVRYSWQQTSERAFGAEVTASTNFREPVTTVAGSIGGGMSLDTLILGARGIYEDFYRWAEVRVYAHLGVAQANIFQAPAEGVGTGSQNAATSFQPIYGRVHPIFALGLEREFAPFDLSLRLERGVSVGALGMAAIASDQASLVIRYFPVIAHRHVAMEVGFNAGRSREVEPTGSANVATASNPASRAIAIANNNDSLGATGQVAVPIYVEGAFAIDASFSYGFSWVDRDPANAETDPPLLPTMTHTGLFVLRGTWGRGTLQQATGAGGLQASDAEDPAYTRDGEGSRLGSSQLLTGDAPSLSERGRRPGEAPTERQDSISAFEAQKRKKRTDDASGPDESTGTEEGEPSQGTKSVEPVRATPPSGGS